MRLTQLVESVEDGRWRCGVCQWRCTLGPGEAGRCLVRIGDTDGIAVDNDGMISAAAVSEIEEHRLWHCFPGTTVLAIGGWGSAFPSDQQRGQYAIIPTDETKRRRLPPERAAVVALEKLCRGVLWTFSDPTVSHEYVLDLLRISRAQSRYTALVTSGYLTLTALDEIGHYLDAICLDLRAFDDSAYTRLAGVEHWRGILEIIAHAQQRWGCHIEITTRLHPNVNDAPEHIQAMASWISTTLGEHTPWHMLPGDAGAAAAATVARARRIARDAGLHFVYGPDLNQSTLCPACGAVVIERRGGTGRLVGLDDGCCAGCGGQLHIRTSIFKRDQR